MIMHLNFFKESVPPRNTRAVITYTSNTITNDLLKKIEMDQLLSRVHCPKSLPYNDK